ncbi:hypothetical protein ACVWZW_005856 [Bradyrhizobium sp. F1.13.4]
MLRGTSWFSPHNLTFHLTDAAGRRASVRDDGPPLVFAEGLGFLAGAGDDDTLAAAVVGPGILWVAGGAGSRSLDGGASESGGATKFFGAPLLALMDMMDETRHCLFDQGVALPTDTGQ